MLNYRQEAMVGMQDDAGEPIVDERRIILIVEQAGGFP
jgi:hypothetical protein